MSGEPGPLTLAFDTATPDTVVGLGDADALIAERVLGPGAEGRPRHGPGLLGAVEGVVGEGGGWPRVGRIAVGIGPGSFTGIRIGVATARALAQARRLPIVGVETSAALAAGIPDEDARGRPRLAVIDARRGEVFAAILRPGAGPDEPVVSAPEALPAAVQGLAGALAAGDGAVRFRHELETVGVEVLPDQHPAHRLSARPLCVLSASNEEGAPEAIRPLYLRRPDAERWLERDSRN
jgi:tRNA threonylcarbamoyladenosine biosynthesis protein TsaB